MSGHISEIELRRGDRVSIVGEVDDGLIRAQAVVLGSTTPDWYVGQLEDGSEVEFRIDQVEDVEEPGYEMGGFLNWFKKKPSSPSRSLIPSEPGGVIYVGPTGVAKYEPPKKKKKGILAPVKEAIKALFTMEPGEGTSPFDIFRTKTSLVPHVETPAVKTEKPSSIFAYFVPPESTLAPIAEKLTSLMPPPGPTPLAPYIEKAQEIFQFVEPSPEPMTYEEKKARQMETWEGMFEPSKEEESLSKMFETFPGKPKMEAFPESEVVPDEDIQTPDSVPSRPDMAIKAIPMPARNTMLPSVEDVARGLIGFYVKKNETFPHKFFNTFKEISEEWRAKGAPGVVLMEPFETVGLHDGHPDPIEGMSIFLQIPWEEFRERALIEDLEDGSEEWVDVEAVMTEIIYPGIEIVNEAFRLIKPADVPGDFELDWSKDCGCFHIYYIDKARPLTEDEEDQIATYGGIEEETEEPIEEEAEEEKAPRAPKKKKKTAKRGSTKAKKKR